MYKEILNKMDEQLENDRRIIDELRAIRNTLKEFNLKEIEYIEDYPDEVVENFVADNYELVYNKYFETYPEELTSDTTLEDVDYIDFVKENFEEELENY